MHNVALKEAIAITPSGFFEFLKKDKGEFELRDNPKFTSRTRNVDTAAKNRWHSAIEKAFTAAVEENPDNTDLYLERVGNLNRRVLNDSASTLLYHDEVLDYTLLKSTLVEKVGYVTYFKDFMTWYDLSDKFVDLLSIMTGTSPDIIECFLARHLKYTMPDVSVKEFSRRLLGSRYVPAGYALGLLDNLCPTVNNFFKGLLAIGLENNYLIRGKDNLCKYGYETLTGQELMSENVAKSMSMSEVIDVYLCNVFRLLCYYILGNIYNVIIEKRRNDWSAVDANGRVQLSELLTGWSHADLVFQNSKGRKFPTIALKGRNDLITEITPVTCGVEGAIKGYLEGNIIL